MARITLGEMLVRRKLEPWSEHSGKGPGVPSYRPGQEKATLVTNENAAISWVDDGGAACLAFATKSEDGSEWVTHPQMTRAGVAWMELRALPKSWVMQDRWLRLIQAAATAQRKGRRTKGGSDPKSDAPNGAEESGNDSA